jgi:hypothetical protein
MDPVEQFFQFPEVVLWSVQTLTFDIIRYYNNYNTNDIVAFFSKRGVQVLASSSTNATLEY